MPLHLVFMAKYRNLTTQEYAYFEKEFVDFLVVNGIVAEDWQKMKVNDPPKAMKIMDLFSDVIMESVLRKIQFLELRTATYLQVVHCLSDKMVMAAVHSKDKNFDMTNFQSINGSAGLLENIELFTGEKKYEKSREMELFDLTEKGYTVTDGKLYKALILATA